MFTHWIRKAFMFSVLVLGFVLSVQVVTLLPALAQSSDTDIVTTGADSFETRPLSQQPAFKQAANLVGGQIVVQEVDASVLPGFLLHALPRVRVAPSIVLNGVDAGTQIDLARPAFASALTPAATSVAIVPKAQDSNPTPVLVHPSSAAGSDATATSALQMAQPAFPSVGASEAAASNMTESNGVEQQSTPQVLTDAERAAIIAGVFAVLAAIITSVATMLARQKSGSRGQ